MLASAQHSGIWKCIYSNTVRDRYGPVPFKIVGLMAIQFLSLSSLFLALISPLA